MNSFYNKKVLVTGGAGFVGSHLAQTLVEQGAIVSILDDLSTGSLNNIELFKDRVEFIKGSILDYEVCLKATRTIYVVFHTAAFISVPQSFEEPKKCFDSNVTGIMNLLEACRANNVERFIFSSSCAVYGTYQGVCHENVPCAPTSPYGFSKYLGEQYLKHYAQFFGIKAVSLRYFNIYGDRQNPHGAYAGVIAKLRHQLKNNLPLTIFGDGSQSRDFISVHDIVKANLVLAQLPPQKMNGDVYNIGTGTSTKLLDMVTLLKKDFPHSTSSVQFLPARAGDIHYSEADCSKYQNILREML